MKQILVPLLIVSLSGCAVLDRLKPAPKAAPIEAPVPAVQPPPANPMLMGQGKTAAALDQTSAAEKAKALAAPAKASERELGKVAVSLGSPAEQGLWLRTVLVSAEAKGRVMTADGQSLAVDLLPGQSGAQLSLAAFRALGLKLTDLPEVTVYGP